MTYNSFLFTGDYEGTLYQEIDDQGYVIRYLTSDSTEVDLRDLITESEVTGENVTFPPN